MDKLANIEDKDKNEDMLLEEMLWSKNNLMI